MTIMTLPVPETKDSILRPITLGITKDLITLLSLDPNTQIFYPDEMGVMYQHNTTIEKENEFASRTVSASRLWIEIEEEVEPESVYPMTTRNRDGEPFLFADDALRIYMQPSHVAYNARINFRATFLDRTSAERWRNMMRGKASSFQIDLISHLLTYHYIIPKNIVTILRILHKMRENRAGYGETFDTWLKTKGSKRFTNLSNLRGRDDGDIHLAVAEKQTRVWGQFDFGAEPEKGQKESGVENWTISFNYSFRYERPNEVTLYYPIMVHNQLIPEKIRFGKDRLKNTPQLDNMIFNRMNLLFEAQDPARTFHERHRDQTYGVYPIYDEWFPPDIVRSTKRMVQVLLTISEEDPHNLFNLETDDFEHEIHEEVMSFIKEEEYQWIHHPYESVFNITLYNQHTMLDRNYLRMDENCNIFSPIALQLRNMYHVRLSVVEDWTLLSQNARRRLLKRKYLAKLLWNWLGHPPVDDITDKVIDEVMGGNMNQFGVFTVENAHVIVRRWDSETSVKIDDNHVENINKFIA